MTDKHTTKASDIMDEACLGEPFVSNGVVAALKASIESALRSAAAEEREECAKRCEQPSMADELYRILTIIANEGFPNPRDADVAIDAITTLFRDDLRSRGIPND